MMLRESDATDYQRPVTVILGLAAIAVIVVLFLGVALLLMPFVWRG
jgi:hypothetical protein